MNEARPKRVAFVASIYRHLEVFHLPFIKLLQDRGYEVHAFARSDHGKKGVEGQKVICHDIQFNRSPCRIENIKAFFQLVSKFKAGEYQMVHVHTPVAGVLSRLAAKIAGITCVVYTAHGFHFFKGAPLINYLLYYPVELIMARCTDYLITINQEDYQRAKRFPVRKETVYIPGVGLDSEIFRLPDESTVRKDIRNQLGINEEDFIVISIGELNVNKNQIQIVKAVEKMLEKNKKVRCLLVGSGKNRFLEDYIEQRGLQDHVRILGFRKDIPQLLAAADVVAHLSKREGLPRSLMEAMAAGKPIVATDIRGNRDLVVQGETGFLVPVSDVTATVNALARLTDNPESRTAMGRKNRERALQYDIREIIKQMELVYDRSLKPCKLLSESRPG